MDTARGSSNIYTYSNGKSEISKRAELPEHTVKWGINKTHDKLKHFTLRGTGIARRGTESPDRILRGPINRTGYIKRSLLQVLTLGY